MRQKISFKSNGVSLAGQLEQPDGPIRAYALFAHCFTCGKDIIAATKISSALSQLGIAVLRFDFTGLGGSEGDFANTNFSSNCQDLIAAAQYLRENFEAPTILIGHSLGGAAILSIAHEIPEAKAMVTIGAPSSAAHLIHHFTKSIDEINEMGEAEVNLAGRKFTIKKQFLEDIDGHQVNNLSQLKKALLILHAPLDKIVPISEAEKIYTTAKHPKSFISLDNADHLLTNKDDAIYTAEVISSWAKRYLAKSNEHQITVSSGEVIVEELNHKFSQNVFSDDHHWIADEPKSVPGGQNIGPDPYEHLLAALGTCTSMTVRMFANLKKIPLEHIKISLSHKRIHANDCEDCESTEKHIDYIEKNLSFIGDLTDAQQQTLIDIAQRCPVNKTLKNTIKIDGFLAKAEE